eukprot:g5128.t1
MLSLASARSAARKLVGHDGATMEKYNEPQDFYGGTVEVEIISAKGLPRADRTSSDPFVELIVGEKAKKKKKKRSWRPRSRGSKSDDESQSQVSEPSDGGSDEEINDVASFQRVKTSTKKKTLKPEWNETLTLDFPSWEACRKASVKIKVWDWDLLSSNDLMCVADLGSLEMRSGALIREDPKRIHARVNPGPWSRDLNYPIKGIPEPRTIILENKTKGKDRKKPGGTLKVNVTVKGFPRRTLYNELMARKNAALLAEQRRIEDEKERIRQMHLSALKEKRRIERKQERALRDEERRRLSDRPASEDVLPPEAWAKALEEADLADGGWRMISVQKGDLKHYPSSGDIVQVHYEARIAGNLDKVGGIDSSYQRNQPYLFKLGNGEVLKGWEQALPQMSVGQVAFLCLGAAYAYGSKGLPYIVPGNASIVFQIKLLSFMNNEARKHIPAALAAKEAAPEGDDGEKVLARLKHAHIKDQGPTPTIKKM